MKLKEFFDSPEKWCQGNYARDKYGNPVNIYNEGAVCFCLAGGLERCYRIDKVYDIKQEIKKHLKITTVENWNDYSGRNFHDITKLVNELDI